MSFFRDQGLQPLGCQVEHQDHEEWVQGPGERISPDAGWDIDTGVGRVIFLIAHRHQLAFAVFHVGVAVEKDAVLSGGFKADYRMPADACCLQGVACEAHDTQGLFGTGQPADLVCHDGGDEDQQQKEEKMVAAQKHKINIHKISMYLKKILHTGCDMNLSLIGRIYCTIIRKLDTVIGNVNTQVNSYYIIDESSFTFRVISIVVTEYQFITAVLTACVMTRSC